MMYFNYTRKRESIMLNIVFKEFEKIAIKQVNGIENIICLDLNLDKGNLKYDLESTIREKYIENIYFIHYQYRDYVTNLQNIKCNLKKKLRKLEFGVLHKHIRSVDYILFVIY